MDSKDSEKYLNAYKRMRAKGFPENTILEHLAYAVELYDTKLLNMTKVKKNRKDGVLLTYKFPLEYEDLETDVVVNKSSLDVDLFDFAIELKQHSVMTQTEAAEYCQVTVRSIQRWEREGLGSWKVANKKFYTVENLDYFKRNRWRI